MNPSNSNNHDNTDLSESNGDHPNDGIQLKDLYMKTPFMKSEPLTKLLASTTTSASQPHRDVYIKLDNLQRSGSYKDRGMANLLYHHSVACSTSNNTNINNDSNSNNKNRITKIVCSSGGNAGLAAALVAKDLQLHCTVVVPITTKQMVIDKLRTLYNADVVVTGTNWNEADQYAKQLLLDDRTNKTLYVPPYDHPLLWSGISSVIDEIYEIDRNNDNMRLLKESPSTIIISVGGGGLLCGVIEGLNNLYSRNQKDIGNNNKVPMPNIICCETEGTNSFQISWNNQSIHSLQQITSIATSLGALSVTPVALQRSMEYHNNPQHDGTITSMSCTDAEAVDACIQFARDHRMLVEPACGAALAMIYSDRLREQHFGASSAWNDNPNTGPIVIEICGGNGVNIDLLHTWEKEYLV